jgi:hypothetical protein
VLFRLEILIGYINRSMCIRGSATVVRSPVRAAAGSEMILQHRTCVSLDWTESAEGLVKGTLGIVDP